MEKEERNIPGIMNAPPVEAEFLLQWGSRKRLRCVRVRGSNLGEVSSSSNTSSSSRIRRRITSRFLTLSHKEASFSQPTSRHTRNSEMATLRSETRKSLSPEKEDRYYTTRGYTAVGLEEIGKITMDGGAGGDQENHHHHHNQNNNSNYNNNCTSSKRKVVWPKLCVALSSKEKEEDFMAMKGCKLPQRPKKRAKIIQRTLLLASPGAWLSDMSWERYEVREKKTCKKKARGLKAMGSIDTDSD